MQPSIVEALLLADNGDADLPKGLSPWDIMDHQRLIAYDIFTGLGLDENGLTDFVTEALTLVDEDG